MEIDHLLHYFTPIKSPYISLCTKLPLALGFVNFTIKFMLDCILDL